MMQRGATTQSTTQGGAALLLALWAVMLLAVIAVGAVAAARSQTSVADASARSLQAEALADAGIRYGVYLVTVRPYTYVWTARHAHLRLRTGTVEVTARSEHGRIDLNRASAVLLRSLASALGGTDGEAMGKTLVAWREGRDAPQRPASAAQTNSPHVFLSVEELLDLPGMTRDVYRRLAGAVTVFNMRKGVDVLSAPRAVLLSLPGATTAKVDDFLARRVATAHAGVGALGKLVRLAHELFPQARPYLVTRKPSVFDITAKARLQDGAACARRAVVRVKKTAVIPYTVLAYGDARIPVSVNGSAVSATRRPVP